MNRKQRSRLIRILLAAAMTVGLHFVPAEGALKLVLYLIPYGTVGYDILRKAWKGILNRQMFDENFLMAVATVGALVLGALRTGDYMEAVAVMLFYQVGELFQSLAVGKSRRNIGALMDLRPDSACVERNGVFEEMDPEEVSPGSLILVKPGEKIPLDGVVEEGTASLNTSALTGESRPQTVRPGDTVASGCVNMNGALRIRTTREYGESTAAKVLELVENATSRKSRSEQFITRFARVYTPAVVIGAAALAVIPPVVRSLFLGQTPQWDEWVYRALTFLVISCPCALVISIPLSFFAGIGGAGAAGILIKGSNFLEALSKTGTVAFDKTGTLTQGVFEVTAVHPRERTEADILEMAALAESASAHPIAACIRRAWGGEPDMSRVTDIREISGHGICACVDGREIAAGNGRLMDQIGVSWQDCHHPGTIVHVAAEKNYAGHMVVSDRLKPEARAALEALKKAGVRRTVMLTGDRQSAAKATAAELGIDEVSSGLLPEDKVAEIERLLEQKRPGETVVFAGDGINDAPVLARADVGIAMGAMGSDAAIEAADVVLMDDNPEKIAKAIRIARKCMRIVYENIVFALGVKGLCLLVGAIGIAGMGLAIFADVGVMILAVLNAIRALAVKNL